MEGFSFQFPYSILLLQVNLNNENDPTLVNIGTSEPNENYESVGF